MVPDSCGPNFRITKMGRQPHLLLCYLSISLLFVSQCSAEEDEKDPLPPPTFSPYGGTHLESITVTLSCPLPTDVEKTIFYTLDGSEPTVNSTAFAEPFTISTMGVTEVRAIAVAEGYAPSITFVVPFAIQGEFQLCRLFQIIYQVVKGVAYLPPWTLPKEDTWNLLQSTYCQVYLGVKFSTP
jgi:hypothetical protein